VHGRVDRGGGGRNVYDLSGELRVTRVVYHGGSQSRELRAEEERLKRVVTREGGESETDVGRDRGGDGGTPCEKIVTGNVTPVGKFQEEKGGGVGEDGRGDKKNGKRGKTNDCSLAEEK